MWANLLISIISGIVGGNVAGAAVPADKNLGALGNTISGIFGGGCWKLYYANLRHYFKRRTVRP